jgi:ATP-binding cassette subfamily B (MDR/TAP) protein 1
VADYDREVKKAERAGIWQSLVMGCGFGCVFGTMFCTYGLALWYGSTLVLNEGLSGGQVINVIFAVLMGAM